MRYCYDSYDETYNETIGVDVMNEKLRFTNENGGTSIKAKACIWDTGGQERFRVLTPTYCSCAHAIMLVFDITDRKSFDEVRDTFIELIYQSAKGCI